MRIELGENYDKYNRLVGKEYTEAKEGVIYNGIIRADHPDFNISLVRGEHYYGTVIYWLDVKP